MSKMRTSDLMRRVDTSGRLSKAKVAGEKRRPAILLASRLVEPLVG